MEVVSLDIELTDLGLAPRFTCAVVGSMPGTFAPLHFPEGNRAFTRALLLRVAPERGTEWYGLFESGDFDIYGLYCGPSPDQLTVVSGGSGYIVSTSNPSQYWSLDSLIRVGPGMYGLLPVCEVWRVPDEDMLVMTSFTDVLAYRPEGLAWFARDVAPDGLHLTAVTKTEVTGYWAGRPFGTADVQFALDVRSGIRRRP